MLRRARRRLSFRTQYQRFRELNARLRPEFPSEWSDRWPRLNDDTGHLPFDAHYVYHTAWAARILAETRPPRHVDVSSYTYFATIVSAFVPVAFYDYRPAAISLSNLHCGQADLCKLPFEDRSICSLSCMHTIEHIGLGRYGDPLDAEGDIRALRELQRVLAPRGSLIIVVPVGQPRIQFNAHRIYDPQMIVAALPDLKLHRWAVLPDNAEQGMVEEPSPDMVRQQRYACGCFWFQRPERDHAEAAPVTYF